MPSTAELLRKLKRAGFRLERHAKRHDIYRHPSGRKAVVPRHAAEMRTGLYLAILRDAGVPER